MFRKPAKKPKIRQKVDDGDEEDDSGSRRVEDVRELQRSRERKHGLTAVECAYGKQRAAEIGQPDDIGALSLSSTQKARLDAAGIVAGIREQFEKETLLRNEHEELRKFIDAGLKGKNSEEEKQPNTSSDTLTRVASRFISAKTETESELLSNQMLAGIPEVDLGINARMINIVKTEKKKRELLEKAMRGEKIYKPIIKPVKRRFDDEDD